MRCERPKPVDLSTCVAVISFFFFDFMTKKKPRLSRDSFQRYGKKADSASVFTPRNRYFCVTLRGAPLRVFLPLKSTIGV
jgi:hypothetical protein